MINSNVMIYAVNAKETMIKCMTADRHGLQCNDTSIFHPLITDASQIQTNMLFNK